MQTAVGALTKSRGPTSTMSRRAGWRRKGHRHEPGLPGHHLLSEGRAHRPPKAGQPCLLGPSSPSALARPLPKTLRALCALGRIFGTF